MGRIRRSTSQKATNGKGRIQSALLSARGRSKKGGVETCNVRTRRAHRASEDFHLTRLIQALRGSRGSASYRATGGKRIHRGPARDAARDVKNVRRSTFKGGAARDTLIGRAAAERAGARTERVPIPTINWEERASTYRIYSNTFYFYVCIYAHNT